MSEERISFFTHTSSSEDSWSTFMPSERLPLNLSSSLLCLLLLSRSRDIERRYCLSLPYLSLSPDLWGIHVKEGQFITTQKFQRQMLTLKPDKGSTTPLVCAKANGGWVQSNITCVPVETACGGENGSVAVAMGTSVLEVSDSSCGGRTIWDCYLVTYLCLALHLAGDASCRNIRLPRCHLNRTVTVQKNH